MPLTTTNSALVLVRDILMTMSVFSPINDGCQDTDEALRSSIKLGEIQAGVANSWSIDDWRNLCHMLETEFVESRRVFILQV